MLADSSFLLQPTLLKNFLLIGDFDVDIEHGFGPRLTDLMTTFGLTQVVKSPTRISTSGCKTTIDLCFISNPKNLQSCVTKPPISTSDHNSILVTMTCQQALSGQRPKNEMMVWRYCDADTFKIKYMIESIDWSSLLCNDVDVSWKNWKSAFLNVIKQCVPRKVCSCHRTLPWINNYTVNAIRRRDRMFVKYKNTRLDLHWLRYKKMRNKVVKLIRDSKHAFFSQVSENVRNPQKFWHVMKSLMSTSNNSLPDLSLADGSAVTKTDLEKAQALNEYFCKCFNKLVPPLAHSNSTLKQNPYSISEICQVDITADEVQHLLSFLSPRKAHGVDGITPSMLRITAASIAPSIALLFNHIFKLGHLSQEWKTSIVVLVPKGKDKHLLSNYRPISLIPIISKVMEKHIASILRDAISLKCPISQNQWGFCPHKSTATALASTVHGWTSSLHDGNNVCTVFFDLKKAFDSVPHQLLLAKLLHLNYHQHCSSG